MVAQRRRRTVATSSAADAGWSAGCSRTRRCRLAARWTSPLAARWTSPSWRPDIVEIPAQHQVELIQHRHPPRSRARPASALAEPNVDLAERPPIKMQIGPLQRRRLISTQPAVQHSHTVLDRHRAEPPRCPRRHETIHAHRLERLPVQFARLRCRRPADDPQTRPAHNTPSSRHTKQADGLPATRSKLTACSCNEGTGN